ncbi:hypothetical protein B0H13DRAFT_2233399 [Mycena leptocephala]|nr:hypothetical protein B0H13DRAFT_2233399 [Mycena leptocephala]
MEAHRICVEAQFVIDSLPNADLPAVERSAHQLGAMRHNVRIERLWRDVRKDSFETFQQIFDYLEKNELLDMENPVHSACLYLVFHRRIQASLDHTRNAGNHHRLRTEHDKTPREAAITRGYWTGDPGDAVSTVDPLYGYDGEAPAPPSDVTANEPLHRMEQPAGAAAERESGILVNGDEELDAAQELLGDFDCNRV